MTKVTKLHRSGPGLKRNMAKNLPELELTPVSTWRTTWTWTTLPRVPPPALARATLPRVVPLPSSPGYPAQSSLLLLERATLPRVVSSLPRAGYPAQSRLLLLGKRATLPRVVSSSLGKRATLPRLVSPP